MTRMSVGGSLRARPARGAWLCAAMVLLGLASPLGIGSAAAASADPATPAACTNTAAITLGAPATTGTIGAAGQVDCYTFDGTTGDRVHVRVVATDGTLVPSTSVADPSDSTICGPTTDADQICTLTATGTQTIVIEDSSGTETGDYSVLAEGLLGACDDMNAITLGAPATTGTIATAGQVDCYSFDGTTGDRVHVHVVASDGDLAPNTSVIDGSGATVCGPTTDADQVCTLTSDGPQAITIADSSGTGTGGYTVSAEELFGACSDMNPITLGAPPSTGAISNAGQVDCYTFDGSIGDRVHINVAATDGTLVPSTSVVDGSNTTVCEPTTDSDQTCHLPSTGSFVIVVQDQSASNTGDYTVFAEKLPITCTHTSPIGYGKAAHTGSIGADDVALCYSFKAKRNARVRVRVVPLSGTLVPSVAIMSPAGNTTCGPSTAIEQTCTIAAQGVNTVMVRDLVGTNTGTFAIYIQRFSFPYHCTPIAFGDLALEASISVPGNADCYTFRAGGGRRVRVRVVATGGTLVPDTEIIDSGGVTSCGPSDAVEQTCQLGTSRRNHMILVRDLSGPNTGSYAISAQIVPGAINCAPIGFGAEAVSAAIDVPGSADCYTFSGKNGDFVRVRVVSLGGSLVPSTDVIKSNGTTLCGPSAAIEQTCRLTTTGKQTIMVRDLAGPNTGSYALYVQRLDAPVGCSTLAIGDPALTDSISVAGDARCYIFAGPGGATVRFDVAGIDGTLVPDTEILKPNGNTLCGPSTAAEQICRLPSNGKYAVFIRDAAGTGTGSFTVAVNSP